MAQYVGRNPDELWVGNVEASTGIPKYLANLKTARLGDVALDVDGNPIEGMLPMFVHKSESVSFDVLMLARGRRWNYLKE